MGGEEDIRGLKNKTEIVQSHRLRKAFQVFQKDN